jgi:hypothetical protein
VCGESGSVSEDTVEHWKKSLPDVPQGYELKNVLCQQNGAFF